MTTDNEIELDEAKERVQRELFLAHVEEAAAEEDAISLRAMDIATAMDVLKDL